MNNELEDCIDDPASRPRDVRYNEVFDAMLKMFDNPTDTNIFEAMETVSVNQLDLADLYKISQDL